jgi:hypothetical protein
MLVGHVGRAAETVLLMKLFTVAGLVERQLSVNR